jgi:hypothetical protein
MAGSGADKAPRRTRVARGSSSDACMDLSDLPAIRAARKPQPSAAQFHRPRSRRQGSSCKPRWSGAAQRRRSGLPCRGNVVGVCLFDVPLAGVGEHQEPPSVLTRINPKAVRRNPKNGRAGTLPGFGWAFGVPWPAISKKGDHFGDEHDAEVAACVPAERVYEGCPRVDELGARGLVARRHHGDHRGDRGEEPRANS